MLQMRARGYACRDGAADVLSGLYLAEEIQHPARDVTPVITSDALEIPDDIPAITETEPASDEPDDMIADVDGFLSALDESIALCGSVEELSEIEENNRDIINRLPKAAKRKAESMLKEAAE